ncbi:MAG: four helix bundle protein [Acidobacteria bacterium]|nr:MAG: four helix bundle protein [Acidobacteriota bacterium]
MKQGMTKLEIRESKSVEASPLRGPRVKGFTDLQVWRLARELRKLSYCLMCGFPSEERYVLSSQLRRAAISITANIAEGFGRYSYQENIQFCRQARGSAFEVRDHLTTALDASYITPEMYEKADALTQRVVQTLNGYIRSTKTLQAERKQASP